MVARTCADLPRRRRLGEECGHLVPVEEVLRAGGERPDIVQCRLVVEELTQRDRLLARSRELGPVRRHRYVVVEQSTIDEPVHDRRHDPLRGGEAHRHGVARPRIACCIASAGPGVDHELAVVVDGDSHPAASRLLRHQLLHLLGDRGEVGMYETFHASFLSARRPGAVAPKVPGRHGTSRAMLQGCPPTRRMND